MSSNAVCAMPLRCVPGRNVVGPMRASTSCSATNAVRSTGGSASSCVSECTGWRGAPTEDLTAPSSARIGSSDCWSDARMIGANSRRASLSASRTTGSSPSLRSCRCVRTRTGPKRSRSEAAPVATASRLVCSSRSQWDRRAAAVDAASVLRTRTTPSSKSAAADACGQGWRCACAREAPSAVPTLPA
eukprot:628598-Prymnesium_polylepis.1